MNLRDTPHGYKRVVPFEKTFRLRLPDAGEAPRFCHGMHAVPVSIGEFPAAMRDYPIVFFRRAGDYEFAPMIILGMHEGQNLFVMGDNKWDRRAYVPAYIRRYPFCLVAPEESKGSQSERVICVDQDAIDEAIGRPMFDDKGEPLPHWHIIERMLHEYEDDLAASRAMCRELAQLQLLEHFTLRAELVGGFSLAMENLYRVSRERLMQLADIDVRHLLGKGYLDAVYAHLFSQENFQRLLGRRSFFSAEPPSSPNQYN